MNAALQVRGLRIAFDGKRVVDDVSFTVERGECVAIVGESGAGKSLTARALLGLTPAEATVSLEGLLIDGRDAAGLSERAWRDLRGAGIALVSQDALVSLDPLRRVGAEVAEPLLLHRLVRNTPLSFLFARPSWLGARPRSTSQRELGTSL